MLHTGWGWGWSAGASWRGMLAYLLARFFRSLRD